MSSNNNTKAKSADSEDVSGRKRVREEVNGGEEEASKTARGGAPTSGSATGATVQNGVPPAAGNNAALFNANLANATLLAQYGLGGATNRGAGAATHQHLLGLGAGFPTAGQPLQQRLGDAPGRVGALDVSQGLASPYYQQLQGLQGSTTNQDVLRQILLTNPNPNLVLERAFLGSSAPGALNTLLHQNNSMAMILALRQQQAVGLPQQMPPPMHVPQAGASIARRPHIPPSHHVDNSGTKRMLLYVPSDDESLSPYQCFSRQNIELFEAQPVDVQTGAQGRNKPVKLGQVGIRCIHCADLHPKLRTRAAVYYPSRLSVLYQAAQNIVNMHLPELCESIPDAVRAQLVGLDNKRSSVGGGKNYWSDTAQIQGVIDSGHGLSFQDPNSAEAEAPTKE